MKLKKMVLISLLVAVASILGYVESLFPSFFIPGVKLGLANIVILFSLYHYKWYEAFLISILRIVLVSLVLGSFMNISFYMSISGGILSFILMLAISRFKVLSEVFVSVVGSLFHGLGQIAVAIIVMGSNEALYYLPFIMLLSIRLYNFNILQSIIFY